MGCLPLSDGASAVQWLGLCFSVT